jgi:hypothetical protein
MAKVMLFRRDTYAKGLDMRYMDDVEQKNHVERFMASGYLLNPPTVCMFNPTTNEQLIIHAEDQPILEARGFQATPTWVYHPTEGRKVVSKAEADKLFQEGWYDTPGKFPGNPQGVAKARTTLIMPKGAVA